MRMKSSRMSGLIKSILLANCVVALSCYAATSFAAEDDSYSQDVVKMSETMTTVDCAQCHYEIFMSIKNGRGAHRLECQECHETYHSFRQGASYKESLPVCINCHDTPHGESEEMIACKTCHSVPHTPLASLSVVSLEPYCATCHAEPGEKMQSSNADHGKLKCGLCHSEGHGYVPTCQECHGVPHASSVTEDFDGCLDCHGNPHDLSLTAD